MKLGQLAFFTLALLLPPTAAEAQTTFRFKGCSAFGSCHWVTMIRVAQGVNDGLYDEWVMDAQDRLPAHPTPGWSFAVSNYFVNGADGDASWSGINTGDFHPEEIPFGPGLYSSQVQGIYSLRKGRPGNIVVTLEHIPNTTEYTAWEQRTFVSLTTVPEPGTFALLGGGLGVLGLIAWRRRRV